ncbi:uncharacterized protein STEHIDRAFT_143988 [Stereum hirsutum FP-91666 SS1]|uniref:uncharacterized protein n=1 Tax=Stereum hirsutum (strain FP-91666) TaxID=721885 RepID=UPI000440CAE2|nr:uncharacterized protein STEHIDRAFT_143988 [Stereum hirsutum FP-91666 SS1]EIM92674.1 hypothetical protein STEHIDRAFT_143988 [Stereum hirsutum FP-91666 SS1]
MFSFSSVAIFATLALSTITSTSALPTESRDLAKVGAAAAANVNVPRCGCSSMPDIFDTLTTTVTPLVAKLNNLGASDCGSTDAISPITDEIKVAINVAITDVTTLVGAAEVDIFGILDLGVLDIATALVAILNLVFGALGHVITVAGSANASIVIPLLAEVGTLLLQLVSVCIQVLGGLLAVLLPLLQDICVPVCIQLSLTATLQTWGVNC